MRPLCQSFSTIRLTVCRSGSPPWKGTRASSHNWRTEERRSKRTARWWRGLEPWLQAALMGWTHTILPQNVALCTLMAWFIQYAKTKGHSPNYHEPHFSLLEHAMSNHSTSSSPCSIIIFSLLSLLAAPHEILRSRFSFRKHLTCWPNVRTKGSKFLSLFSTHKTRFTFSNFPVWNANFFRKSSAFPQDSILYVFLMYSGLALSSTVAMWSSGLLIFSIWTWKLQKSQTPSFYQRHRFPHIHLKWLIKYSWKGL